MPTQQKKNQVSEKLNVYYDINCRLCNVAVKIAKRNDKDNCLKFISNENIDKKDTVIVEKGNIRYEKSDAVRILLNKINFKISYLIVNIFPKFFRNLVYDFIARYRYNIFGKIK